MPNNPNAADNLKPFKKGETGNPAGRPPVSQKLKEMREEFGEWPRTELMRLAQDQRLKPETRVRVLQYLDEQFNGRAKQSVDLGSDPDRPLRTIADFYADTARERIISRIDDCAARKSPEADT